VSEQFRAIRRHAKDYGKKMMYVGVDTAYYTCAHEFALCNNGDPVVNAAQLLHDHSRAHLPGNCLSLRSTTEFNVLSVIQSPEECSENYRHSTFATNLIASGQVDLEMCAGLGPCSTHEHITVPRTVIAEVMTS